MTPIVVIGAVIAGIVAAAAISLLMQQRRAIERMASALTARHPDLFAPGQVHLVGRSTHAPSYIPPTDEVVWRPKLRRLRLDATALEGHTRPEYELSL